MDGIKLLGETGEISRLLAQSQSMAREKRRGRRGADERRKREKGEALEFLAIAPSGVLEHETLTLSRILLLPGVHAELIKNHPADCVISYGTAEKDSVSFSSIEKDRVMISLRRELPTILGEVMARSEFVLPIRPGVQPVSLLFWAGLSLVLGLTEEELWHIAEAEL